MHCGFAAAFIAGTGIIVSLRRGKQPFDLMNVALGSIRFGFIFLTYGILTGAVWANVAWTTYWGWDPKETWALLTWVIYFVFLILYDKGLLQRTFARRLPLCTACFSIGGFSMVLFTYLGVNYLPGGLHGYL